MNLRHAISMQRQRKNSMFEQERAASLDYDSQRAGGYKQKKPAKTSGSKSNRSGNKPSH
jgi:hypothetical protein